MKNLLCVVICLIIAGCAPPFTPKLSVPGPQLQVQTIQVAGPIGVMAASPDGKRVAWADMDLNLQNLQTGRHSHLSNKTPETLCWSADGEMLAATFLMDGESHLYVYDRDGELLHDQHFPGLVSRLRWPQSEPLTASVLLVKSYRFGTNIRGELFQWDGGWKISRILLYETTLTPAMVKMIGPNLLKTLDFDLSPLKDEVLYSKLYAPPAFAASQRLMLKNLQTGKERLIAALPLLRGGGRLARDGESVYVQDGLGSLSLLNPWLDKPQRHWAAEHFEYDVTSNVLLVNNTLMAATKPILELPNGSRAKISSGGKYLLVAQHAKLYLVSGYSQPEVSDIPGVASKKLQKLRRLRSRALITPQEYQQARESVLQ